MPRSKGKAPAHWWATTGEYVNKADLKRMYTAVPMIVISNAIDNGIETIEGLMTAWTEHNIQVAKNVKISRKESAKSIKHWQLHTDPKVDYRNFPDRFK